MGMPKNKRLLKLPPGARAPRSWCSGSSWTTSPTGSCPPSSRSCATSRRTSTSSLDEKGHAVHLTDRGVEQLCAAGPDAVHRARPLARGAPDRSRRGSRRRTRSWSSASSSRATTPPRARSSTSSTSCCGRTRSTSGTSSTSCRTGKVLIVDEFTGRIMPGRRWSDGLHQAVEAKEGVTVERETQTYATITIQNYFRMYEKLAGMTGTAETEETEFNEIYKLEVVVIPTNRPCAASTRTTASTRPGARSTTRSSTRSSASTSAASPCWSARPASRSPRRCRGMLKRRGRHARGPERQVPPAGGRDRRAGRAPGRRHHRDQHGRPRHRHQARRRRPSAGGGIRRQAPSASIDSRPAEEIQAGTCRPPAAPHHRHRAPRVAAHRPPAARPLRPPGRSGRARSSSSRSRTT